MSMDESIPLNTRLNVSDWRRHTENILLGAGGILVIAGIMGLIANSHKNVLAIMPIMLLQLVMIIITVVSYKVKDQRIKFDLCLLANTLVAFAMLGLIYTSFENAITLWMLFSIWTLMLTPWATSAYTGMIWLFWIAGLNLSLVFIYITLRSEHQVELSVFIMVSNLVFLGMWEFLSRRTEVFNTRAGSRLVVFLSLGGATALAFFGMHTMMLPLGLQLLSFLPWLIIAIVFMNLWGRNGKDVFISAITALYFVVGLPTALGYLLFTHPQIPGSFSFFSLLIFTPILVVVMLFWLRRCFKNRIKHAN